MRRPVSMEILFFLLLATAAIGDIAGFSVHVGGGDPDGDGGHSGTARDGGSSRGTGSSCVYDLDDTLELCHLETAKQKVQFELIRGPATCQQYVVKEVDCLGCKYVPNQNYSHCVNGHKHKHEDLVPGSKAGCPTRRKITKECVDDDDDEEKKKTTGGGPVSLIIPLT